MTIFRFSCFEQEHDIFGKIARSLITVGFYSERFKEWLTVGKVLADTGADISVIPLPLGQILVSDVEKGQPMRIGGALSSNSLFNAFIHRVQARIGNFVFEMPVAVSLSSAVRPILGRREAIDRFTVSFVQGRDVFFKIKE